MDKELENLLDNYENAIYGKAFPIVPSVHQLHLLLDYISNLSQQCKKQKKVIDKVIKYVEDYTSGERIITYEQYKSELLDILKEVSE